VSVVTEQATALIGALAKIAWPLAVIIFLFKYQVPLGNLLDRITRVKAAGLEVEAQERTREVLDEYSDARLPPPPADQTLLTELAKSNPRLAINLSWARVRDASAKLAAAVGISTQVTVRRIERLARRGYATEEMVSLARTLKGTQVAYLNQPNVEPPQDLAEAFAVAALSLAQWFEKRAPEVQDVSRSLSPPSDYPPSDYPPSDYPPSDYPPSDHPPSDHPRHPRRPHRQAGRSENDGESQAKVDAAGHPEPEEGTDDH
jgi:DNA-binding Lrp family transcriptional regulator